MLRNTPLFNEHKKLNARLGAFGGWQMPIQYDGIIAEHNWTRSSASIFDICHMGEFIIKGDLKKSNIDSVFTMKLDDLTPGRCRYGFILNEEGNIIDDLIVYRLEDKKWMVVVNAATTTKDEDHIRERLSSDSEFTNISDITAKIDIQGPLSKEILFETLSVDVSNLKYFNFKSFSLFGEDVIISRTGYTGELGYEIYINSENVEKLWQLLCKDNRVKPGGLGARDTLRLEMCYPLYGQDIDETKTPYEANLMNFVCLDKDFYGKEALLKKMKDVSTSFLIPLK
ncbi:MAG: glycine cleavage system aminomethyltransferase GcvT, partial [Candidatus Omnitrophota bacterium]